MSRDDGFAVMDVSTSWLEDDKVRRLAREFPSEVLWAVAAYDATRGASWRHGKRLRVQDSLPAWLDYDAAGVRALMAVKLLDRTGRIPVKPWREWFGKAFDAREKSRKKWRDWNARKEAERATEQDSKPSANGLQTASSPTVPSSPTFLVEERVNETVSNGRAGANGRRHLGLVDPVTA